MARPASPYNHAEAFCVMTYTADDGSETEQVWNSRDGVTPFVITLRSGKRATHTNWAADRRMPPDWTPPRGMRRFVDLTTQRAREHADTSIERWLADADPDIAAMALSRFGGDRDTAAAELAGAYLTSPGAPDLIDDPTDPQLRQETPAP